LFVCKDDGWAITTRSAHVSGGNLKARAAGFGLPVVEVDGSDVKQVWEAACVAVERARSGKGPTFLHARCVHLEAHFLGFQLTRAVRDPLGEMPKIAVTLTGSLLRRGGGRLSERLAGLKEVIVVVLSTLRDPRRDPAYDPIRRLRKHLLSDPVRLQELEDRIEQEMNAVIAFSLAEVPA
jgi:TPP-dependent pyruvate/acetoin dehydrogenase alpha subunit